MVLITRQRGVTWSQNREGISRKSLELYIDIIFGVPTLIEIMQIVQHQNEKVSSSV